MTVIGELAVNAVVRTEGVEKGVRKFRGELSGVAGIATSFSRNVLGVSSALGAAAAGFALVQNRARKFDDLVNASDTLGITAERMQELNYAASQSSNVNDLGGVLNNLARQTMEAASGLKKPAEALMELGLDARQLAGMGADRQLLAIADAMDKLGNRNAQIRIAERLGMDSSILTMLDQGSVGIRKLMDEARSMGLILDEANARSLADTNDSLDKMYASVNAAGDAMASSFAPAVTVATDALTFMLNESRNLAGDVTLWAMGTSSEEIEEMEKQQRGYLERQRLESHRARADREIERRQKIRAAQEETRLVRQVAEARAKADEDARERLQDRLSKLSGDVQFFGMDRAQREIAEMRGGSDNRGLRNAIVGQLETLQRLTAERERAAEAEQRWQDLQQRAAGVIEANRTPLEELHDQLGELRQMYQNGLLDASQFGRAVGAAQGQYNNAVRSQANNRQQGPLAAIQFGSSAAVRAIVESRNQEQGKKIDEKQLKAQEDGNRIARETLAAIKEQGGDQVAAWK